MCRSCATELCSQRVCSGHVQPGVYADDNVDLCDVLSSFSFGAKVKLDELSRIMGLPGKPDGIDGSQVETYFDAGRIQEIADYTQVGCDQHVPAVATA